MEPQPQLGILPKRRPGLGSRHSYRATGARSDLMSTIRQQSSGLTRLWTQESQSRKWHSLTEDPPPSGIGFYNCS